jgi:O-antigen/teichoic acid export membrane protein
MKKNNFVTGTFIATASIVLVKILGMIYVVPFYIIVGSKGGALYSYAYNIYLIFLSISSAGIPSAISKIISEYNAIGMIEAKTRAFKIGKKFIGYFSVVAFILLFIFAEEIASLILGTLSGGNTIKDVAFVIRCVSFAVLIIPHLSVTKGYLQGHNYFAAPSTSNIIEQVVRIFIILTGSYLAYKVFNSSLTLAVGIAVSGAFFGGLVAYWYLKKSINNNKAELNLDKKYERDNISNKEITKKIAAYAIPFIIINIISSIYSFTDMVLILRTLDHLGYSAYDVEFITSIISTWGSKICVIINSIAMGITVTLIPSIVEAYATHDWVDLNRKINKSLQIVIYVSLPLTFGLAILAIPVWTIFYNINHYGGEILRIMVFNSLIGNVSMIVSTILQSCNKYKAVYLTNAFGCLFNAFLDVPLMILCNQIGIGAYYGALIASFIAYSISIYIGLHSLSAEHKLSYKETYVEVLKSLVPTIVMTIVLLILNNYLPFNVYSRTKSLCLIIIDVIVGGVIFIGISIKMHIPQHIFGDKDLNKILKKLTFGKFQIKEED